MTSFTTSQRLSTSPLKSASASRPAIGRFTSRAALTAAAIGALGLTGGCSSLPEAKGPSTRFAAAAQARSRDVARAPRILVTAVRDPLVRGEIRSELNALKDYQNSLKELRTRYAKVPLPGPLTIAKLENDLAVAYFAKVNEAVGVDFKVIAETSPARETVAPLANVASTVPLLPNATPVGQAVQEPSDVSDISDVPPDSRAGAMAGTTAAAGVGTVGSIAGGTAAGIPPETREPGTLKRLGALDSAGVELSTAVETPLIFDYPVTYNVHVRRWIQFFQTSGRSSFRNWLERSSRFLPFIQHELTRAGLPQDLSYVAMIESGFVPSAVSHASAMGLWQFIATTGHRYGLRTEWWLDERRDFQKSTRAAIGYMTELYRQFNSWYLVAASYNMGENGVRRLMQRHGTNNFWELADRGALPEETRHYVPKIIAAMLISKAPALYGFRDLDYKMPFSYEFFTVPGGTDLVNLAAHLGVSEKYLKELNPELIKGFIPRHVKHHRIRIPKGAASAVAQYVRVQSDS